MLPNNELAPKSHVTGFAFPVKGPGDLLEDWEMAGVAINDPTQGMWVKLWHIKATPNVDTGAVDCVVDAPGVDPIVLFSGAGITEVALAFDQNMNPFVAYMQSGQAKIYWYDPTIPGMTHTDLPSGCKDLRCTLDDKRSFNAGDSDIVLAYVRDGNLCSRLQRDRYSIETILKEDAGEDLNLVSIAMNTGWCVQFRLRNYSLTDDPGALIKTDPLLADIVYDLCIQAGIKPENIDVSELWEDSVPGLVIASDDGLDKPIKWLMEMFQFDKVEYDGKIHFPKRGRAVIARIPYNELIDDYPNTLKRTRRDLSKLPKTVNINHIDPDGGFAKNKQSASRRTNVALGTSIENLDSKVILTADQAASAALRYLKSKHNETEDFEFSTRLKYTYLTPCDVIEVEDFDGTWYRVRLKERNEDDGTIKWEAETDGGYLVYDNAPITGKPLDPPVSTTPGVVGRTELDIINVSPNSDSHDELGLYVAVRGSSLAWTGCSLNLSTDEGDSYAEIMQITDMATGGETLTDLADEVSYEYQDSQTLDVEVNFPLSSATDSQVLQNANRFIIGDEECQYTTATLLGMNGSLYQYRLSGLVRGRYNTAIEYWPAGTRFILFNGAVKFIKAEKWMMGLDLYSKAITFGSTIDETTALAYMFDTPYSQIEWPPAMVQAVRDGSDVTVTWIEVMRLGRDSSPYHSKYCTGYRVKFSDDHVIDVPLGAETAVYASAPAGLTVQVCALNSITGEGQFSEAISV